MVEGARGRGERWVEDLAEAVEAVAVGLCLQR